jgi:hypothetical protein
VSEPAPEEPTTTTVIAPMRRSFQADMFVDLTGPDVAVVKTVGKPCWTFVFDAVLSEETVAAIRGRVTSTDDVDEAARAGMRGLRGQLLALVDLDPVTQLLVDATVAGLNYQLGENP